MVPEGMREVSILRRYGYVTGSTVCVVGRAFAAGSGGEGGSVRRLLGGVGVHRSE